MVANRSGWTTKCQNRISCNDRALLHHDCDGGNIIVYVKI